MVKVEKNPYALYVRCDGAMDYDSKNTGGIGFSIEFPEHVPLSNIEKSIGRFEKNNIETLELKAINEGMRELLNLSKKYKDEFRGINTIIFTTDRLVLSDEGRTNPYKIQAWRKNKGKNHENKPIKNFNLLDEIDKNRKKISQNLFSSVEIKYIRRKYNKIADKLAETGKASAFVKKEFDYRAKKVGNRLYGGDEIDYRNLRAKEKIVIRPFLKEFIREMWEINAEICTGPKKGQKLKIYTDSATEKKLHRKHVYEILIENSFNHHVTIFKKIKDITKSKELISKL